MNKLQKIFVIVGVGSLAVLLITIFGLGFKPIEHYVDVSGVDTSLVRHLTEIDFFDEIPFIDDADKTHFHNVSKYQPAFQKQLEDTWLSDTKNLLKYKVWKTQKKMMEGVQTTKVGIPSVFKSNRQTNWLGIIALFNIVACTIGFFLFKD